MAINEIWKIKLNPSVFLIAYLFQQRIENLATFLMILQILKDQFILHIFKTVIALLGEISTIENKKGWYAIDIQYTQTQFSLYNFYTQFKEGN